MVTETRSRNASTCRRGDSLNLGIPGLKTHVLGPVGPKQWELLKKHEDTDELWKKLSALHVEDKSEKKKDDPPFVRFDDSEGTYGVPAIFGEEYQTFDGDPRKDSVRWLIDNMDRLRGINS